MNRPELTDREAVVAVLEFAPDGILLVADSGQIALVNDAAEKLFGYGHEELAGRDVELLLPERFRRGHIDERKAYEARPRRRLMGTGLELVGLRKDGSEFPAEISLSPMRWDGQSLVVAIVRDVSDRKAAEAERIALARAQAVEQVVSGLDAIVWEAANPERTQLGYVGGRDEALLGYPRERWLEPGFWLSIIHPDDRTFVLAYSKAARAHETFELEYRLTDADGRTVTVHDVASRVDEVDGDVERLRGVMVDVSERRELEARLSQASKMEAIGQLAGGIAHDFNNLLTIVSGHARRLARRTKDSDRRQELSQIIAAADRAAALTKNLLAFARRDDVTIERVDLAEIVKGLIPMLESVLQAEIALDVQLDEDAPAIEADRTQLERVLMNLILNARDAMPHGGALLVSVANVCLDDAEAIARAVRPGRYAALGVSDSGHGIPPDVRGRIFEPFFTTKDADHGTGLGLATVYGIVKEADGYIEVDTEPGSGSTFRLGLPAADRPAGARYSGREGTRGTILVVDDEPALRALAGLSLADAGYAVLQAANGREALALAERYGDRIELLLTDVAMPQLSGPELALQLRKLRPDLRVLYMSGYHDSDLAGRGLGGKSDVIRKPFDPDELPAHVDRILKRGG